MGCVCGVSGQRKVMGEGGEGRGGEERGGEGKGRTVMGFEREGIRKTYMLTGRCDRLVEETEAYFAG